MLWTLSVFTKFLFILLKKHVFWLTGLVNDYSNDATAHRVMRKVMSLPLLPAEHMTPAFELIADAERLREPSKAMTDLLAYVQSTWLNNTIWPVESVSVYRQHVRTNNDVEGWHRALNHQARRASLPLYLLVVLLHDEACRVRLTVRLLSENRLRKYARRKYSSLTNRLLQLWDSYESGEVTTSGLLRAASHLQLPNFLAQL